MSTTLAPSPADEREARPIKVRRISFDYREDDLPKHFMDDDLVMSHVVAVLSAVFPAGEDYFVRSVRNYRDQITDPVLKRQVASFIGQEAIHGREHRELNERLGALGYPTRFVDRFIEQRLRINEKIAPKSVRLAVTAALEHYTATLAEQLLEDPTSRAQFGSEEVLNLLLWHAIEESEHKAVAFDVFQAVNGNAKLRARVMNGVSVGFITTVIALTAVSLVRDPASRDVKRLARSLAHVRHSPWLTKRTYRRIRDYNRPDFHPDDHDSTALLEEWRDRLFGEDGTLVDHLEGRAAS